MPRTNTMRITGLLILIAAYAMHQRGLFIAYHLFRVITLMRRTSVNTQVTQHGPFEGDHRREWGSERHCSPKAIRRINGFVVMLILLLTLFVMLGMACNKSPSAPVGLYRLIISPPAKGEYVALAMPLKMIAGMPGDWISTTPLGTYINGTLVPNSAPLLPQHYPYGTFELGPSSLWLIGKDPRSWDSRYFGPVPETLINATAKPIWVRD